MTALDLSEPPAHLNDRSFPKVIQGPLLELKVVIPLFHDVGFSKYGDHLVRFET